MNKGGKHLAIFEGKQIRRHWDDDFVVPLLIAIIAVLAIGGGVYVYENKKAEVPTAVDNTTQQSNQVQQPTVQNNPVNSPVQNIQTPPPKVILATPLSPVSISSISGPIKLNDGKSGTWTVNASGQKPLTYGVIWGDEPEWKNVYGGMPLSFIAYKSSPSFSHTYYRVSSTGTTYTPAFFVKDAQGMTTRKVSLVNVGFASSQTPIPYIGSINPSSVSVGTTIEIRGSSFKGFEGDVYFFFERADGKKIRLPGIVSEQKTEDATGTQIAKVIIKEPCQSGQTIYGDYSGIPYQCDYVQFTPGVYKVSTETWGNKSNTVQFTVVASNFQPSVTVLYPNMGEVLNNGGRDNITTVRWTTSNFGNMNITIGLLNKNGELYSTSKFLR